MICDKYKDDLLEAAVSGQAHEDLEKHLDQCPCCREMLRCDCEVLAKVQHILSSRLGEEPSVGFLARTRAQIARHQERGWNPAWGLAAAVAGLILITFLNFWMSPRPPQTESDRSVGATIPEKQEPVSARIQTMPSVGNASRGHTPRHASEPARPQILSVRTPEVLVPPEEGRAFRRFVARLAEQQEVAEAFVSNPVEPTVEQNRFPDISPVEIADLRVTPLAWEKWKPSLWSGQYVARKITSESEQK
jgi:hypothetical protein